MNSANSIKMFNSVIYVLIYYVKFIIYHFENNNYSEDHIDAAEARKILESARENGERQKMMIIGGAREDITHMIEEATRKVMAGEESADPYEDFIRNAERSRANGHK